MAIAYVILNATNCTEVHTFRTLLIWTACRLAYLYGGAGSRENGHCKEGQSCFQSCCLQRLQHHWFKLHASSFFRLLQWEPVPPPSSLWVECDNMHAVLIILMRVEFRNANTLSFTLIIHYKINGSERCPEEWTLLFLILIRMLLFFF